MSSHLSWEEKLSDSAKRQIFDETSALSTSCGGAKKSASWGSSSRNGCCLCLSSCCHSALANEAPSAEPMGGRRGGREALVSLWWVECDWIGTTAIQDEPCDKSNISPAEEIIGVLVERCIITVAVLAGGPGPLIQVLTGRLPRRRTATKVFGLFSAPQESSSRGRRGCLSECHFHFQTITARVCLLPACVKQKNLMSWSRLFIYLKKKLGAQGSRC